MQTQIVHVV